MCHDDRSVSHPARYASSRGRRVLAWMTTMLTGLASTAWSGTAQITGTILDETTKLPVAGMCAEVYGETTGEVESDPTGPDGVYTIAGLSPDRYHLIAYDCDGPVDRPLVEYRRRSKSLHGAHSSSLGARLVKIRRDGQVRRKRDFRVPLAGHITVTVVDDATGDPVPNWIVLAVSADPPRPTRSSLFVTGFFGVTDAAGQVTLDVAPGLTTPRALVGGLTVPGPTLDVPPGGTLPAEIRLP